MTIRLVTTACVISVLGFSQADLQTAKSGVNFYSIARETEIGRTISDNLRASLTIVDNVEVARVLAALSPHAEGPFEYHVLVFNDSVPPRRPVLALPRTADGMSEPLAVAGGWIFVPSSLVTRRGSESQLAAMLAHSMAHVAARHATRLATKRELVRIGAESIRDNVPAVVPVAMSQAMVFGDAQFARSFELQADALAIPILKASGYDPQALIDYVRTVPSERAYSAGAMPKAEQRVAKIEAALTSPPTPSRPVPPR